MTPKRRRALEILLEGPLLPEEFYCRMWPTGRWAERDPGSTKGGPSRTQCAANWFLGRMGGLVQRTGYLDTKQPHPGKWRITPDGREALRRGAN